ncbi:MAG TPA: serine hydrolase domain-containing protein [Tepidisphaeraceae bacterium]|nr:serine hydrolase domain-containing protein [Tepidisphaeraceae bacterium]
MTRRSLSERALGVVAATLMMSGLAHASHALNVNMDHLQQVDAQIAEAVEDKQIPGAVLLVGRGDETVYRKAYGNRSVEPTVEPMTEDTIFDLASLSKPIGTATSIMILADRGKIDVKAPVANYLPAFGSNGKEKVTIEQLLLHRGGLIADNPMSDYTDDPEESLQKILNLKLKYEPGRDFIYTDMGYVVLGEVVRAVSGKPLNEFAAEEIFKPLGMKDTSYLPPASWVSRVAPTEKAKGKMLRGTVHDPRAQKLGGFAGHAGIFSTADDVGRYCRMLLNNGELDGRRIMSARTVEEMIKPRCMDDETNCRTYGFDANTKFSSARGERFDKTTTFGHTGWTGTMLWVDPVNDCYFVLLSNRNHPDGKGNVLPLRRKVATIVGEALLGKAPATQPESK